jgi:hypothetical protein
VADCILQLRKPIAFDPTASLEATGRFVIVDDFEIAGGGIIREALSDDARKAGDAARDAGMLWLEPPATPGTVVFLAGAEPVLDEVAALLRGKVLVLGPVKSGEAVPALGDTLFHVATAGADVVARLREHDRLDGGALDARLAGVHRVWVRVASETDDEGLSADDVAFKPGTTAAALVREIEARLSRFS